MTARQWRSSVGGSSSIIEDVYVLLPGVRLAPDALHRRPTMVQYTEDGGYWNVTLSYSAVTRPGQRLVREHGQAVAWHRLDNSWRSVYPHDAGRLRAHASRLARDD